jgi:uncharacterized protein YndB with AHSA1/START domain
MTESSATRANTRVSRIIKASRQQLYQACLDPVAVASWRVPDAMKAQVHAFDAREGGRFRMTLTYLDVAHSPGGKSSEDTDTFEGRFVELLPGEKIVERIAFESRDLHFAGEMTITTRFRDMDGGTEITILCENLPAGIRPEDNEMGSQQALRKLAALIE